MKHTLAHILMVSAACAAASAWAEEPARSVNFGVGGLNPMPHCNAKILTLEYESLQSPTTSILGRISGVNYHFDDHQHMEDGHLRGADIGSRYYPAGRGMQGFFLGASLGVWHDTWVFNEAQNTPNIWWGWGQFNAVRVNFDLGDRIPIPGTRVSILPQINFGKFLSGQRCTITWPPGRVGTNCPERAEVDFYLFAGVSVAFGF